MVTTQNGPVCVVCLGMECEASADSNERREEAWYDVMRVNSAKKEELCESFSSRKRGLM